MTRLQIAAQGDHRERSASVRLVAPADSWTGAELRSLPCGGSIRIEAQSNGPVRLLMTDADSYASFPDVKAPLFDRRIEYSTIAEISLPQSGDYYLIADNRRGDSAREVLLALHGRSHDVHDVLPLTRQFEELRRQMDSAFDLRGLDLQLADPGPELPAITGRRLIVGRDFIRRVEAELPDERAARGAILFAILHAVAADWLVTETAPEPAATRHLAAALMVLFNQIDGARSQAAHFAERLASDSAVAPDKKDPTNPFSAAAARSVLHRLKDPQTLLRDMQGFVLPRMRPEMLEQLRRQTPGWADPQAVDAALARHFGTPSNDRNSK